MLGGLAHEQGGSDRNVRSRQLASGGVLKVLPKINIIIPLGQHRACAAQNEYLDKDVEHERRQKLTGRVNKIEEGREQPARQKK